jgi:hypothetical protein
MPRAPITMQTKAPAERTLSRHETHDLGQIIKDRTKVMESYADEQAAKCMADFERHLATIYRYDQDEVWKEVTERAMAEIEKAQEKIYAQAAKKGIPRDLAPLLQLSWQGRGQMATANRREELRRVAKREVEAMKQAAITKIRRQSLDLRTQVVTMGLVTAEAKLFLESLAPIEDAMQSIDFADIETKLLAQQQRNRKLGYGGIT